MSTVGDEFPRSAVVLVATRGVSSIGSTLTTFGLNVWVFRATGSYATFAFLAVLVNLPVLLFAPFAGVMTDRFNKKKLLITADLVSAVAVLVAFILYLFHFLVVPVVAVAMLTFAIAGELRWSSMSAMLSIILPKGQLHRANGLQQAFRGANVMLGPLFGAVGLDLLGLPVLLGLDILSYVVSVAGFLFIRVNTNPDPRFDTVAPLGFINELTYGFRWVWNQPNLRRLLFFFMVINVGVSVYTVTFPPYVLSFAGDHMLGASLAALGSGAFLSGLYLGKQSRRADAGEDRIVLGTLFVGLAIAFWGVARSPVALLSIAFCIGVLETIIMSSSQTAWQIHVPKEIQGKVFAVRTVTAFGLVPLTILGSVPFATNVFQPLLNEPSSLPVSVWGAGQTGAMGMMVSTLGIGVFVYSTLLLAAGGLRLAEAGAAEALQVAPTTR